MRLLTVLSFESWELFYFGMIFAMNICSLVIVIMMETASSVHGKDKRHVYIEEASSSQCISVRVERVAVDGMAIRSAFLVGLVYVDVCEVAVLVRLVISVQMIV